MHVCFVSEYSLFIHSLWSYNQTTKDDQVAERGECRWLKPKKKVKFESPLSQTPMPVILSTEACPKATFIEARDSLQMMHNCPVTESVNSGLSRSKSGRNAKLLPPSPSFTKKPLPPPHEKPEDQSNGAVPAVGKRLIQAR